MSKSIPILLGLLGAALLAGFVLWPRPGTHGGAQAASLQRPGEASSSAPAAALWAEPEAPPSAAVPAPVEDRRVALDPIDAGAALAGEALPEPPPPSDAPARGVIAEVVDSRGLPLAGARLHLVLHRVSDGQIWSMGGLATSEADGRVVFPLSADLEVPGLLAFRIDEPARQASGWSAEDHPLPEAFLDIGQVALVAPMELDPVPLVFGWVGDGSGAPIPGVTGTVAASIFVGGASQESGSPPVNDSARMRTGWRGQLVVDPTGTFRAYGPANVGYVQFTFSAAGYQDYFDWQVPVPTQEHRVVLVPEVLFKGRLLVPEQGPPVEDYAVWMSEEGLGFGITVGPDGSFTAKGSTKSTEFSVTQPSMGATLYSRSVELGTEREFDLGDLDLRGKVRVLDVLCKDPAGQALAERTLTVEPTIAIKALGVSYATNSEGRLLAAFPLEVQVVLIQRPGGEVVTLDLFSPPLELILP